MRASKAIPIVLATALAVSPSPAVEAERRAETDRFVIVALDPSVTDEEVEMAKAKAERFYEAIRDLLGSEPPGKVVIDLEGPAERPDGSWGYPRVDGRGTAHLYRYTDEPESYFNALAHELVHVFRSGRKPHHNWFFEEGFAEFLARRVDPSLDGFPWYGFPVDLVAAQWIATGEAIPLTALRERHRELNLPCKLQSYALRGAFFDWLGRTYGDETLIAMSEAEEVGALADYERRFGKSLEALEREWREALLAAYREDEEAKSLARRYRQESPAQYQPVCPPGGP